MFHAKSDFFLVLFFLKRVTWASVGTASILYWTILRDKLNDLFTGHQLKNVFKIPFYYLLGTDSTFQDIMHNIAIFYYVIIELFHYFLYLLNFLKFHFLLKKMQSKDSWLLTLINEISDLIVSVMFGDVWLIILSVSHIFDKWLIETHNFNI